MNFALSIDRKVAFVFQMSSKFL